MKVFEAQVAEADRRGKPLVIHCVRCFPELIRLKTNAGADSVQWVLHGFRGAKRKAFELLDAGFALSFGAGGAGSRSMGVALLGGFAFFALVRGLHGAPRH